MKSKLISVIIPCYNVEEYLFRCFDSLQNQTIGIEHLQLIFIDDASTDHTWDTLLAIEAAHPTSVLIIHCEENRKQGTARNMGLKYAACPYIAFLDADDWIEHTMYEKLYYYAISYDCDIVRCGSIRDFGTSPYIAEKYDNSGDRLLLIDTIEKRKGLIRAGSLGFTVWDKLYKKNIIVNNKLVFPENIAYEDHAWCSYLYMYASHIYITDEKLYHYFVNNNSTVLKKDQDYHRNLLTANLIKWSEWEQRDFLHIYRHELEYDFLLTCYLGYLKVLFLRFTTLPFEEFLLLKKETLLRIPHYHTNSYIKDYFTPLNQILLELLNTNVTPSQLEEIAQAARNNWLSITIFAATHVKFEPPDNPIYLPLHVGKALNEDLGYMGDDTGDNISPINCYYGELTGLYWIWKNYTSSDYIGLCHYRRYFLNTNHEVMTKEEYLKILQKYDIIISKPVVSTKTYHELYEEAHNINDLLTIGETIKKVCPEFLSTFKFTLDSTSHYCGNLFVTSKLLFDQYAEWLFTLLKAASQSIDTDGYDDYHKRVYGFLSEQLIFVWAKTLGLNIYECDIGFTQEKAETIELKNKHNCNLSY